MRRRVAGLGQNGRPGLDFERGWHWKHACGTGKRSRVAALAEAGGAELSTAHGGLAAPESFHGRKQSEREEEGVGEIPHTTKKPWGGEIVVERRWSVVTAAAAPELELAATRARVLRTREAAAAGLVGSRGRGALLL